MTKNQHGDFKEPIMRTTQKRFELIGIVEGCTEILELRYNFESLNDAEILKKLKEYLKNSQNTHEHLSEYLKNSQTADYLLDISNKIQNINKALSGYLNNNKNSNLRDFIDSFENTIQTLKYCASYEIGRLEFEFIKTNFKPSRTIFWEEEDKIHAGLLDEFNLQIDKVEVVQTDYGGVFYKQKPPGVQNRALKGGAALHFASLFSKEVIQQLQLSDQTMKSIPMKSIPNAVRVDTIAQQNFALYNEVDIMLGLSLFLVKIYRSTAQIALLMSDDSSERMYKFFSYAGDFLVYLGLQLWNWNSPKNVQYKNTARHISFVISSVLGVYWYGWQKGLGELVYSVLLFYFAGSLSFYGALALMAAFVGAEVYYFGSEFHELREILSKTSDESNLDVLEEVSDLNNVQQRHIQFSPMANWYINQNKSVQDLIAESYLYNSKMFNPVICVYEDGLDELRSIGKNLDVNIEWLRTQHRLDAFVTKKDFFYKLGKYLSSEVKTEIAQMPHECEIVNLCEEKNIYQDYDCKSDQLGIKVTNIARNDYKYITDELEQYDSYTTQSIGKTFQCNDLIVLDGLLH